MQSKSDYRVYFANVSVYLKMSYFLKQVNIDSGNFSRFLKGHEYEYLISFDKLENLYKIIHLKIT